MLGYVVVEMNGRIVVRVDVEGEEGGMVGMVVVVLFLRLRLYFFLRGESMVGMGLDGKWDDFKFMNVLSVLIEVVDVKWGMRGGEME